MTAVEFLVQQICGEHTNAWKKEIQQALEMEKQQIISAWEDGFNDGNQQNISFRIHWTPGEYYETIKTKNLNQ
jgi:hypothetical protein